MSLPKELAFLRTLFKKQEAQILSAVLLGLFVRIALPFGSWSFDESFSVMLARMPWNEFVGFVFLENNPPLFYFILHFWIKLFGTSSASLHALPLLGGLLTIVGSYKLVYQLWKKRLPAFFTSLLLAFAPFIIFFSRELRMYPLLTAAAVWMFWFLWWYIETKKRTALIGYIILLLVTAMLHYGGWVVIGINGLFFLVMAPRYGISRVRWVGIHLIPGILLVWYFVATTLFRQTEGTVLNEHWIFSFSIFNNFLVDIFQSAVFMTSSLGLILGWSAWSFFILFLLLVYIFITHSKKKKNTPLEKIRSISTRKLWVLVLLLVPLCIGYAVGAEAVRLYVIELLFVIVIIGYACASLRGVTRAILITFFLASSMVLYVYLLPSTEPVNWFQVIRYIEENAQEQDLVLIHNYNNILTYQFNKEYYCKGGCTASPDVTGFLPDENPTFKNIIIRNAYRNVTPDNVHELSRYVAGYSTVYLINTHGDEEEHWGGPYVLDWFEDNHWEEKDFKTFGKFQSIGTVRRFEKDE